MFECWTEIWYCPFFKKIFLVGKGMYMRVNLIYVKYFSDKQRKEMPLLSKRPLERLRKEKSLILS